MADVKIKIALGLIAITIFAAPVAIAQEVPPHVVISEVQIATNEFVELYNPTNSAINMTGWYWCYFSPTRNWNNSYRDRTFPGEAIIIPAHGFYLIATTAGEFPTADWNLEYAKHFLSDTAGSVGIFPWDPDTKTAEEAKAGKIDAVGWGSVTNVYETATASTPSSGESIERKPLGGGYAPCQDTDDNSFDFFVQDTPTPKNSSSPEMEPAPVELFDAAGNFKGGFVNIQDAVDNASNGDTIRVDDGTYNENVDVDKQLTICSEHGAAVTTISAPNPNDNVINVTVDHVSISGFNVIGATGTGGIHLYNADYCNIANNSASNNNIGIHLQMSNYNTITNNTVSDNENGISLSSSDDNAIYNNYFENTNNAQDDGTNIWDLTPTLGENIIGGSWLGGNYWCDFAGADTDKDGLGDFLLPYNSGGGIENGGDSHPLVPVGSAPDLSIVKSDELDALPPGGTLRYTIIVENTGNATATNVNVTDTYDANVTFESAVPIPSQGNDTWIFPTLNVSETRWINISVTVNSTTPIGTVLHNSVNVSCDEGVSGSATESTTVSAGYTPPEITSFAPPSPVNDTVGAWRRFNVTVNQRVDVEWYLDNGHRQTNKSVKGASFTPHAIELGVHNVTANASNGYGNDSHSWVWNVKQQGISVTKVGNVTEASPSTLVNFTIKVTNTGDCAFDTVVVNDTLPAGMTYTSSDPPANTSNGAIIIWNNVGPLAVGASETITLVVQIGENAEGVLTNTVNVTGTPPTGDSVSATDTAQVRVKQPGISVTKGNVTGAPSTLASFTITVSNTGDFTLNHVVVKDTLPAEMTYKSSDTPAYTPDGINITWNITGSLDAGDSKTIKLVARIEEDAKGVLTNTVDVTGRPVIGTNVSASATAEVRVIRLGIEKSCKSTTSLGKTVKYTIKYSNPGGTNLTNVVITENYPKDLTFTSAVPAPDSGTNNKWTIGTLPAGESGKITIKMKVPTSMTDFSYTETGSVSGEGIVMISKELSTKVEPFDLKNVVTISGSYGATNVSATASAITTVSVSGSSIGITEHGSGTYESEEELSVSPEKMGIKFDKTTNAEYSPTTFKCSDGFVMEVPSKWSQDICIKNYVKKSAIHKTITEATYMNDNTIIKSDNKGYSMTFDSTFLGYLHVDRKTKDAATSEHYIGEFVITSWDQSGKEIVEGVGYVIVDKELSSGRLLLMEHGSGYYLSEEDSSSNSIKKITVAEYEPTSFNFSDGFVVNFSSKWMQDVCARSGTGTSALHKKIRDATYIDDDTTAKSSPSLKFHTFFYGATHVGSKSRYSKASEDYIGDFYISWGASSTFIFDWDKVPGADNDVLISHLNESRFGMPWVTDDDVKITKSSKKDTITISTPEHSAEIILDTKTNETAELIVDGVDTYSFNVVKHGNTLKVYDPEFKRKPEVVTGEGFVMVDEAIFQDGEIEVTEHGSGTYHSEETFGSKTIEKSTYGVYKPTYFSFSDSFSVNLSSLWMQDICAKDKKEGTAIHKKISDAALMKDDTTAAKSLMNITSSFNGSMHIGVRTENVSISEDYIGEFNVTERIKIVKGKPPKSSSESSDWLFCPCPIPSSIYQWFCQDPTYRGRWLSVCPYPYADTWLYIHP